MLGDDDFIVVKYMENVLEALSSFEPDLLFLGALQGEVRRREHSTRESSLESLFLSESLMSLGRISRLIHKRSHLSSLPSLGTTRVNIVFGLGLLRQLASLVSCE